jgi:DNA-binding MarR family transcriptional regulator
MSAAASPKKKSEKTLPLDRWVAYRFGLIATRIGALATPAYRDHHKLSTSAWRALAVVAHFEPLSAAMLSEHTRLDPSKVSRAIETLVGRKLLTREKDPADQRRAVLRLTPRGREIYADVSATATRLEQEMTATLTAAERKALWALLDKIDAEIQRHPPPK